MINEDVTPTSYDLARPHSTRYIYDARDGEIKADWPVDNKYVELYSAKDFAIFFSHMRENRCFSGCQSKMQRRQEPDNGLLSLQKWCHQAFLLTL